MYLASYLMNERYIYTSVVPVLSTGSSVPGPGNPLRSGKYITIESTSTLMGFHFIWENKTIHLCIAKYYYILVKYIYLSKMV